MAEKILALDVGGTKILGGLFDAGLRVTATRQRPAGGAPGAADPGLSATAAVAAELAGLAADEGDRIVAVGAGFPEYVDRGRLTSSEVLAWRDQPAAMLAALLPGATVAVESDVRCAATAEYRAWRSAAEDRARSTAPGAGADIDGRAGDPASLGLDAMLYVSWGTGLSSTLVLEGRCLTGARGEAIALGEWEVSRAAGPAARGTLEPFASGAGIARRYRALTRDDIAGATEVFARAGRGDAAAASIVESALIAVAQALAAAVALLDPAVVVIGGGLGMAVDCLSGPLAERYRALTARRPNAAPLERARLGRHSGLVGAAIAAAGQAAQAAAAGPT